LPFRETRKKIDEICNPYWIYIRGGATGKDKPYEPPENPDVIIDPLLENLTESLEKIIKEVGKIEQKR